jgi:pentatricopeptide repeat protein
MYGKSGKLMDAHNLLGNLQTSSEVPFVAMIASYIQHGHVFQALELFDLMKDKGMKPGITTYLCILKGCSDVGALQQGRIIHDKVVKSELEGECFIGNTLVDMYGKCGSLREAHNVFDQLSKQDIVSWSAMITSYASHGVWDMATQCLKSMGNCGVKPDESLFVSILSACSQNGLLEEGFSNFERMKREHGLAPRVDHFNCVVDILGRRGHLNDAEDALKSMPNEPNLVGWVSLLMGCGLYGNRQLGGECFGEIKQLNCDDGSGYSLLANLCSGINQHDGIGEMADYMRLSREEQSYHKRYNHILVEAF